VPPRRVTILIDSLVAGGAESVAVEAAAALDRGRYLPHLLVTRGSGSLEERLRESGVEYTVLGRRRGFHPRLFARATRLVAASDLLHAHKFAGSAWGALLATAARRPLVAHEHTGDEAVTLQRKLLYRALIAPVADRIVCVSGGVAQALVRDGVPERKLAVVPNGVPVGGILGRGEARGELGLAADAEVVGMVARLRPEKRHELALAAIREHRERHGRIVLCVVGDGPLREALRRRAAELGLGEDVVFAGERRDARRLMKAFDALLLTSSYEGMPLAVLEALVAGVPVVSTDVGRIRELVAGGGGAVTSDDPAEIAAAVAAVVAGRGGLDPAAARERYGIERLARDLELIYDEVLA
jgi:glycosyltransferase involved in cell wall biosynthesis